MIKLVESKLNDGNYAVLKTMGSDEGASEGEETAADTGRSRGGGGG